jgi:type III secretion system OrgA/MxiK family protein
MRPTAQLLSVMYAPHLYIHADYWPASLGAKGDDVPASIVNQRLIDEYDLDSRLDFSVSHDVLLTQCIMHWTRLPRIFELVGLRCLRSRFLRASAYASLDPDARRFLLLPLSVRKAGDEPSGLGESNDASPATAIAAGLTHFESRTRLFPRALRQRLMLLFSRELNLRLSALCSMPATSPGGSAVINLGLFQQAVNHALFEPS